jgi:hypothetical protein
MSDLEMQKELDGIQTENAQLKTKDLRSMKLKMSKEEDLPLHGMGRFPATPYKEWRLRILASIARVGEVEYKTDLNLKAARA